jgi:hypothetical protein
LLRSERSNGDRFRGSSRRVSVLLDEGVHRGTIDDDLAPDPVTADVAAVEQLVCGRELASQTCCGFFDREMHEIPRFKRTARRAGTGHVVLLRVGSVDVAVSRTGPVLLEELGQPQTHRCQSGRHLVVNLATEFFTALEPLREAAETTTNSVNLHLKRFAHTTVSKKRTQKK